MIQELLGGAASSLLASDNNNNKTSFINGGPPSHLFQSCTAPPPTTTTTAAIVSTTTTATNPSDNNNNLRCPRCDSANTKFCYYNNYNLTQPRHFCKTCRRYWTKGGALRNVPIGGGCRKNKSTIVTTASKSTAGSSSKLLKTISPDDIARAVTTTTATTHPHLGFDHDLPNYSNPILWGSASSSSPQPSSSHLMALLRATSQNPNPNHNPLSSSVKDEGMSGAHMMMVNTSHQPSPLAGRPMGLDHLGHQVPSLGLSTTSLWRSTNQNQPQHQHQHQNGTTTSLLRSEAHNSGMQELYQRLIRSSSSTTTPTTNNYFSDHHPHQSNTQPMVLMGNAGSTSVSSILDSAPAASDQLGYGWNVNPPAFSWSDLPTTNGAYP